MADENQQEEEGVFAFRVTPEDAERWAARFEKMGNNASKKEGDQHVEMAKMFLTAAVLVRNMGLDMQQQKMFGDIPTLFMPNAPVGEA